MKRIDWDLVFLWVYGVLATILIVCTTIVAYLIADHPPSWW